MSLKNLKNTIHKHHLPEADPAEYEKKYRMFFDSAPIGLGISRIDGTITDFNEKMMEITGYSKTELFKIKIIDLFNNPEDCRALFKKLEQGPAITDYEVKLKKYDGTAFDAQLNISPISIHNSKEYLTSLTDITEYNTVKKALCESEERSRYLADSSIEAIIIDKGGICLEANRAAAEMFGFSSPDEMTGIFELDLIASESYERVRKHILEKSEDSYEALARHKNGNNFPVEIRAKLIPYMGFTARVTSIRDITGQKGSEAEKEKMEAQLRQSQKMEAIGTLAGGIAHDFNNILSGIFGYTEIALNRTNRSDPVRKYLEQILQAAKRASELVKHILTLSREQDQEQKPTSITPIIQETAMLLRATLPTTISINTNITSNSDLVMADPSQIHQVIMNLCTNAAHAMREKGGNLTINLENVEINAQSAAIDPDLHEGRYLKVSVTDTGEGIPGKIINRIFDPFFTTKQKGEGTGLGLSMVHGIVKNHKGAITVTSKPGEGSEFDIFLPQTLELLQTAESEETLSLPGGNERILLVDDEAVLVELIKEMLENLGYKITARTSSLEALEAFKFNPDGFDLVITDQTMPNMTGINLIKEIRKIRENMPVILCTGFSGQINPENARLIGIREFLYKPISSKDISEAVRRSIDRHDEKKETANPKRSGPKPAPVKKILIADDMTSIQDITCVVLNSIGYETDTASDGEEALLKIKNNDYAIVFMDINMPVMGGIEATKKLRRDIKSKIPVIALTGLDTDNNKDIYFEAGINDCISKPINFDELKAILKKWLNEER